LCEYDPPPPPFLERGFFGRGKHTPAHTKTPPFLNKFKPPRGFSCPKTTHIHGAFLFWEVKPPPPHLLATVMFERGKTHPDYTNDHFFLNKFQADSGICMHGISSMEAIY